MSNIHLKFITSSDEIDYIKPINWPIPHCPIQHLYFQLSQLSTVLYDNQIIVKLYWHPVIKYGKVSTKLEVVAKPIKDNYECYLYPNKFLGNEYPILLAKCDGVKVYSTINSEPIKYQNPMTLMEIDPPQIIRGDPGPKGDPGPPGPPGPKGDDGDPGKLYNMLI